MSQSFVLFAQKTVLFIVHKRKNSFDILDDNMKSRRSLMRRIGGIVGLILIFQAPLVLAKSGDSVPIVWERPSTYVAMGDNFGCAPTLEADPLVYCWGSNDSGQLGNPANRYLSGTSFGVVVQTSSGALTNVRNVTAGYRHACAVRNDGTVWCWGAGNVGQLGSSATGSSVAIAVPGISTAGSVYSSAQSSFSCAILRDGSVKCWGANESGQMGNGTRSVAQAMPLTVALPDAVESIALGQSFACANYGAWGSEVVACWGNNAIGQLGNLTYSPSSTPVAVATLTDQSGLYSLTAGAFHACVTRFNTVSMDIEPLCWGDNSAGQLGNPAIIGNANYPVLVQNTALSGYLKEVNNIFAGARYTCAEIWPASSPARGTCWGDNTWGQLGDGTTIAETHPTNTRLDTFIEAAGGAQTCGSFGSQLTCWGRNSQGQLGDGTTSERIALGARVLIDDDIFGSGMDE